MCEAVPKTDGNYLLLTEEGPVSTHFLRSSRKINTESRSYNGTFVKDGKNERNMGRKCKPLSKSVIHLDFWLEVTVLSI